MVNRSGLLMNWRLGWLIFNLTGDEIERRVNQIMDFLGIRTFSDRMTDALSGGHVPEGRAGSILAMKTPILLLDQPTAELDPNQFRAVSAPGAAEPGEKGHDPGCHG